ncbi:hypothetical protein KR50_00330 [Jeotgalibacillus campisalis]|uniref:Uncharacterized protein n=1 Tax=Jeotgalibacillus campisalis TaxID=220754 RepID=A0A0C2SFK3_9BACL|nr:hypothetical protein KR50_00330 [Jeotgalibacillus campisalis]
MALFIAPSHSFNATVVTGDSLPFYSGGTALDFHQLPF